VQFGKNAYGVRDTLNTTIRELRNDGYTIVGLGAAAKAMTAINFGKFNIDVILDENALKVGLLTPGMNIPILDFTYLKSIEPSSKVAFLLTAWNFEAELRQKVKRHRDNKDDVFIKYFPSVIVGN
jgi:hypothetical protein